MSKTKFAIRGYGVVATSGITPEEKSIMMTDGGDGGDDGFAVYEERAAAEAGVKKLLGQGYFSRMGVEEVVVVDQATYAELEERAREQITDEAKAKLSEWNLAGAFALAHGWDSNDAGLLEWMILHLVASDETPQNMKAGFADIVCVVESHKQIKAAAVAVGWDKNGARTLAEWIRGNLCAPGYARPDAIKVGFYEAMEEVARQHGWLQESHSLLQWFKLQLGHFPAVDSEMKLLDDVRVIAHEYGWDDAKCRLLDWVRTTARDLKSWNGRVDELNSRFDKDREAAVARITTDIAEIRKSGVGHAILLEYETLLAHYLSA